MADTQMQKKTKKSRKKSESNSASDTACNETKPSIIEQRKTSLPPDLNIKTPENIKVTLVNDEKEVEVNGEVTNKKKKNKKKKSKEVLKETSVENNNSNAPFLNFSENGIHLVNHPEISVTFSDSLQSKVTTDENVKEKTKSIENQPEEKQVDIAATASKKKKKKKKKGNNLPDVPSSTSETSYTTPTPTYTKVVTSDNTCVLVVNNENFSSAAKSFGNIEENKSKLVENKKNFSLSSEKQVGEVLITKNFSSGGNANLGSSVSIFPVLTSVDTKAPEKNTIISQPDIGTVSSILKNDASDVPGKENTDGSIPTKAQLKAERRAKQEAQRAAKLAKSTEKIDSGLSHAAQDKTPKPPKEKSSSKKNCAPSGEPVTEAFTKSSSVVSEKNSLRKVRLFSHLPECKKLDLNAKVHPAILEVGSQYSKGIICGSNARCIALLGTLREIIEDYSPPPDKNYCRDLESTIQVYLSYLDNCRPLSVSMINAVKFLKHQINHIPSELEIGKAREILCKFINDFVNEEILLAKEAIGNSASAKIVDGDVILVFAHSSLVKDVLCKAYNANKRFRVIVADSRPKLEGLEMLRHLVKQGLHCSYITISAVSYVMKEVSKVIIGAHALLLNGCVMSRLGSKQIALVASSYSVPVIVCCETYKFCERVLTDSFVHNELGKPDHITATTLVSNNSLKNWHDIPSLQLLNLLYDVTPSDLISMVITEKGVLPCTSVPVVLRVRYAGLHE